MQVDTTGPALRSNMGGGVLLDRLKVQLGPELRTVYPVVMNFAISGEVGLLFSELGIGGILARRPSLTQQSCEHKAPGVLEFDSLSLLLS